MTSLDVLKNKAEQWNPLARHRRAKMRKRLKNQNVTFLVPNCIGGILFHDLGLRFLSPTVNLMMTQTDFVRFVKNMDAYLAKDFSFFKHPEYMCPCAHLGDVTIHFTHYANEEDAARKWRERAKRINRDNLFIFCEERDGITKKEIQSLSAVKARGIVVFTANQYDDIPFALNIPKYRADGEVGNILSRSYLDDSREYESYFDFVKWFNEADGKNYDVSEFSKIKSNTNF